jgi:hypothetical protein
MKKKSTLSKVTLSNTKEIFGVKIFTETILPTEECSEVDRKWNTTNLSPQPAPPPRDQKNPLKHKPTVNV